MQARLRSLEQLMPSATAGELIAERRQPVVSISPDATAHAALHTQRRRPMKPGILGFTAVYFKVFVQGLGEDGR